MAALLLGPTAGAQDVPVFEAGVLSVSVDVFVTRDGAAVTGLTSEDFEVLDAGVAQRAELVARDVAPVNALLVLDTSGSVAGAKLVELKAAASAFLAGLAPGDHAGLLTFNHRSRMLVAPGSDRAQVQGALASVRAEGGTALHDALFLALGVLDPRQGRPVIVLFSDGADVVSWLGPDKVSVAARHSEAVVYVVDAADPTGPRDIPRQEQVDTRVDNFSAMLQGRRSTDIRQGPIRRDAPPPSVARTLAAATGGRVWPVAGSGDLRRAFEGVLGEVQGRYILRYEPQGVPRAGWHPLEVRLRQARGADLRVRRGYVAGGS